MVTSYPRESDPSPVRSRHVCIRASAGAGKTHQLTTRYLWLLLKGANPCSILASTFTRAAAGEIRDRILQRLIAAIESEPQRAELAAQIGDEARDPAALRTALRRLARNLDRMQVRTLDSFFASVIRAFSLDLGLMPDVQACDEIQAQALRLQAIEQSLDHDDPQQLVVLLRTLTQGQANRDVTRLLDGLITDLYGTFHQALPTAWEHIPPQPVMSRAQLAERILALEVLDVGSDRNFNKAHTKAVQAARQQDWETFLKAGFAACVASGQPTYYKKEISPPIIDAYMPIVNHARSVISNRLRDQNRSIAALLTLFDHHFEQIKRVRGLMLFDDFTRAMLRAQHHAYVQQELAYRLDGTIEHVLLDEFQDTSISQWSAMQPLVEDIVGDETRDRTLFCVGDAKQSIYGWRDACPDLLLNLPLLLGVDDHTIQTFPLSRSWRSSPTIVEIVNRVFGALEPTEFDEPIASGLADWLRGFEPHETQQQSLPGYARLQTVPQAEVDDSAQTVRLAHAATVAASIHRTTPAKSIGILCRSNDAVGQLLAMLGTGGENIPVTGVGGSALTDAAPVNAVLDLLHLADHPDDTIAAFHVAHSPLGPNVEFTEHRHRHRRYTLARWVRRRLLQDGYARFLGDVITRIAPSSTPRELARLWAMVELARQWDTGEALRPTGFIQMVEQQRVPEIETAPVQVMTIHQSKGLEFDVVILPELDSKLTGARPPSVAVDRDGLIGPVTRVSRWIAEDLRAHVPGLEDMFQRTLHQQVREELAVMYVAVTRARQALYMLINPPKASEKTLPKTPAGLLRKTLDGVDAGQDETVFECGDPDWYRTTDDPPPAVHAPIMETTDPIAFAHQRSDVLRGRGTASPSKKVHADASFNGVEIPTQTRRDARDRGIAIHRLFEHVNWLDDGLADDAAMHHMLIDAVPHRHETWRAACIGEFRRAIEHPVIRTLLLKSSGKDAQVTVFRELTYARLTGGAVQRGVIDRLVLSHDDAGSPVSAAIIDFKTDRVAAEHVDEAAAGYRDQIEQYVQAVTAQFDLSPASVSASLVFTDPGVVVTMT
jgi:ATP-dependent helicase/nuclease subunit A